MKSSSLRVTVVVLVTLLAVEGSSYLLTPIANRLMTQPIITQSAFFEGQSEGIRALLEFAGRDRFHPVLGWSYLPGYHGPGETINAAGMRSSRSYARAPSDSTPRIAAFGGSSIYCDEVVNAGCWSSLMEAGWNVEVLNYGVSGYGTAQALLRYVAEGQTYQPGIIILGFAPVHLRRAVNRYPRFLSPGGPPVFRPRFKLASGELQLIPTPVRSEAELRALLENPRRALQFGADDYFYEPAIFEHWGYRVSATYRLATNLWIRLRRRYFDPDRLLEGGVFRAGSEAFELETRTMLAFADSVAAAGASPVFLFNPDREAVRRRSEGRAPAYAPLRARLERSGVPLVDPIDALANARLPLDDLFAPGGHYSREGNRIMAEVVADALRLTPR